MREVVLSYKERMHITKCPNCGAKSFELKSVKVKPAVRRLVGANRVVYRCVECGYWSDWFDLWVWHPPEELEE